MKKFVLTFIISSSCLAMSAQTIVNTGAGLKHAVIEEFTGINCGNCPSGHAEVSSILAANPGMVEVILYCPTNSSYTTPGGSGGTDFRRSYADAFYTGSYCSPTSGSRFMPSAFLNRTTGSNGDLLQSRNVWSSMVGSVVTQTSPMNIGLSSTYNAATNSLDIKTEVYYVSDVTAPNALFVVLIEDSLTSPYQSGSSASAANPYIYKRHFRENITSGQWGEDITSATTTGSLYTANYSFNLSNAIDPIKLENAYIVAYVADKSKAYEIYSGITVAAIGGTASTGTGAPTSVSDLDISDRVAVYPIPTTDQITVNISSSLNQPKLQIIDQLGRTVLAQDLNAGDNILNLADHMAAGSYILQVRSEDGMTNQNIILK